MSTSAIRLNKRLGWTCPALPRRSRVQQRLRYVDKANYVATQLSAKKLGVINANKCNRRSSSFRGKTRVLQCSSRGGNESGRRVPDVGLSKPVVSDEVSWEMELVDSNESISLNREFGVPGYVRVGDGRGGLPKVTLTHPGGSTCDVYLHGANIQSWVLANGGEVFFTPRNEVFSSNRPIKWGTQFCFPQASLGTEWAYRKSSPQVDTVPGDGFAEQSAWTILQTGLHEGVDGEFPYVCLELADDDRTRALWNFSFRIRLDISLGSKSIDVDMEVENTGSQCFEYALALKPHVAVTDIEQPCVKLVGLDDCVYLDYILHQTKQRVCFASGGSGNTSRLKGPTNRVYLNSKRPTGVEVGTGCTVYVHDRTVQSMRGCTDRVVWNSWEPDSFRWYAGLGIGTLGKLVRLEPEKQNVSGVRLEIADTIQRSNNGEEIQSEHGLSSDMMRKLSSYDLVEDESSD